MKWSGCGRLVLACAVSVALLLGVSACGGGTIGYLYVLAGRSSGTTPANVIVGYKIDDFTGNLTEIVNSPFPTGSAGTPVNVVSLAGGRYIYTVNTSDARNSISQFSVGGDGVLTFQQGFSTQGGTPVWMDISGGFLYVLDQVSPNRVNGVAPPCASITNAANTDPCGSVEVFQITTDTGNLTPVLNTSIKVNNVGISYFPVGPKPTRLKAASSSALLVVNGDGTITSFGFGGNGQLTTSANSTQVLDLTGNSTITSITTGQSFVYLTDGKNNRIFQYTVANGVLQPVNGSPYTNLAPNTTPVWTLTTTDSSSNQFLYVLNSGNTTTTSPAGSISAYRVNTTNQLTPLAGFTNPLPVGASPVCMVIDPTNQYLYTSNADGTVTGYQLRRSEGTLSNLRRGSSFTAAGVPTCLTATGIF